MALKEVELVMNDKSGKELVAFAHDAAKKLVAQNLSRTQIRTIFTEVRQIESRWPSPEALHRLHMLKPKLAYQAARTPTAEYLKQVLSDAIDKVSDAKPDEQNERFQRFVALFEAILAYHRAEGGKN
jgi:CRISPR-associated protein Csm2